MYFKRLEMFGFKSFADKTKIDFERGITAIVGPNGCGKSNIADAVKWVLGEQSAKALRGSNMGDIIFNGTEFKEPLGYAEVSLVLSNEEKFLPIEYDEVTISRRLYRSGESEYLINKNLVRRKDINELLMGSGLGTSAYSMIEQGRIDQILSVNPEERRMVFEEASGITKYKSKKREAIRKLEHTEQNLLRVSDIIKEVERQINSIERQAKKARRYQEVFNRLKSLDTNLAAHNYIQMREKKTALANERDNIKSEEETFNINVGEFNKEVEELNGRLDSLNSKISQYRLERNDTNTILQRNQDKISLNRERLQELYRHEGDQKNEIDSLRARITDIEKVMHEMAGRLTNISESTKLKENVLAAKEEELANLKNEIVKNEETIKTNKLKIVDVYSVQSKMRNEIAKIASDMQNVSARLRRLSLEKENVLKELSALDKNFSKARLSVNVSISKIETLEKERIALQNSLRNEKEEFALLEKEINDSKNNILSLHSKLNLLRDLVKRHEGFTGGTQALLNKLSEGTLKLEGLCEPLADLLEPHKGHEAACEAALKDRLQMLVVDNWNVVFNALEFLNNNGLGKASFLKNAENSSDTKLFSVNHNLVLGNMANFMNFNPRYKNLFMRILKKTFLVNTIEDAISVLSSLPEGLKKEVKLVTKKGDIITEDVITGGSAARDLTSSLIGRQKRMKELEEHIADAEKNILILKQELNAKKELIEGHQNKLEKTGEALRSEEINLAQKKSQEESLAKEHKKIREEIDLLDLEIEESMFRQGDLKDSQINLKSKLDEKTSEEESIQNLIADSQQFVENGLKKREGLLIDITQIQTELSSLKREEDDFFKRAREQKAFYDDQTKIFDAKKESLNNCCQRQEELREEIRNLERDIERLEERNKVIEKELNALETDALRQKEIIDDKEEALNNRKEELSVVKEKVHNLDMEEAQLSFQMESLKNRIEQIYKIDLENTTLNPEGTGDLEAVQNEINQLRQTIEKIGTVNLVAIDEHKELQERDSFLKHQQEDLISAKDSLLKVIKKINQTTKNLFLETFASIQIEFRNYFRFLFGGGKAEIMLLDEGDVLESGIEIIVRPPGKKLQTISLLSGGEKALTAIALLFAIFKIKPSPFCLLDEIDAPLDESNIGRFSNVLQEFTKTSQFIIITHNKKTISMSDVMYGITMEDSGVSKIISVKFAKKTQKKEEAVVT